MDTYGKWLLTAVLIAATGLAGASPQTNPRISLNVVAFDSHDQIVGDLTTKDFQVFDDGKPQRIMSFHRNAEPQATLNNVPNAPTAAPPVVILFDLLNDGLANRGYHTEEIIRALEHLELSDSLYLYLLTDQGLLRPVRGLPSPQEHDAPEKTPWTEHIKPLLEGAIDNAYGLRVSQGAGTFSSIEALGDALRPFPGRKNLIWITNVGPLVFTYRDGGREVIDNSALVNRIATALDHNGVTLSGVDQGGSSETLDKFAQLTGGQIYANDIGKAVNEALAASRSGYAIEYDAPPPDGKYHKIRVTCSCKGVRLQVKQGYYAN